MSEEEEQQPDVKPQDLKGICEKDDLIEKKRK